MASPPPRKKSPSSLMRRDRVSELPDHVLGHVLSFLPTKEAGRAAILGRRWRDIFCSVDAISFEEVEGERNGDWYTYFCRAPEMRSCSGALLDCISAALLRRRRQCGTGEGFTTVPLRSFHFAFAKQHYWDIFAIDLWLTDVLRRRGYEDLHLDLRFFIGPICERRKNDDEKRETSEDKGWGYLLPRSLYFCTALRTLCLSHCKLNLPELVDMPFLETLRLTGIHDDDSSIQRLIWSCPRLVDLTLEANNHLKKVSVLDKCLRRFALRCCHNVTKVSIDAPELRYLEYRGSVPEESLMSLSGSPRLASCTIGPFCRVRQGEEEFIRLRRFLEKVSDSKHLHLHHRGLDESGFFTMFPSFSVLTRLVLQGPIQSSGTVHAVQRILEQTPNLEVLSLYLEKDPDRGVETIRYPRFDELDDQDEEEYDPPVVLDYLRVPDELSFSMPCLRHRVKEINVVNYQYDVQHRVLASVLFRNALVLERVCVVFVKAQFALQTELKKEIESWLVTKPEKSFM